MLNDWSKTLTSAALCAGTLTAKGREFLATNWPYWAKKNRFATDTTRPHPMFCWTKSTHSQPSSTSLSVIPSSWSNGPACMQCAWWEAVRLPVLQVYLALMGPCSFAYPRICVSIRVDARDLSMTGMASISTKHVATVHLENLVPGDRCGTELEW